MCSRKLYARETDQPAGKPKPEVEPKPPLTCSRSGRDEKSGARLVIGYLRGHCILPFACLTHDIKHGMESNGGFMETAPVSELAISLAGPCPKYNSLSLEQVSSKAVIPSIEAPSGRMRMTAGIVPLDKSVKTRHCFR